MHPSHPSQTSSHPSQTTSPPSQNLSNNIPPPTYNAFTASRLEYTGYSEASRAGSVATGGLTTPSEYTGTECTGGTGGSQGEQLSHQMQMLSFQQNLQNGGQNRQFNENGQFTDIGLSTDTFLANNNQFQEKGVCDSAGGSSNRELHDLLADDQDNKQQTLRRRDKNNVQNLQTGQNGQNLQNIGQLPDFQNTDLTDSQNQANNDSSEVNSDTTAIKPVTTPKLPPVPRVKPVKPEFYRFYIEQHMENIVKEYRARKQRLLDLERQFADYSTPADEREQIRSVLYTKETQYLRRKRQKLDKTAFTWVKTLGVGAFGEVALCRKIDNGEIFAIKTLKKSEVVKKKQVAHVKAERDILSEADCPWIPKLHYSFHDRENLYFVTEYVPGGDLMSLLIKKEIFEEELGRFYTAELVCALEYVHKMGYRVVS